MYNFIFELDIILNGFLTTISRANFRVKSVRNVLALQRNRISKKKIKIKRTSIIICIPPLVKHKKTKNKKQYSKKLIYNYQVRTFERRKRIFCWLTKTSTSSGCVCRRKITRQ